MKENENKTPLTFSEAFPALHTLASAVEKETCNKSVLNDFLKYDVKTISGMPKEHFPILFCIRWCGTAVIQMPAYGELLLKSEIARWQYAQDPTNYYLKDNKENREAKWFAVYLGEKGDVVADSISYEDAVEGYNETMYDYVEKCKARYGEFPTRFKVKVRFHGITISRLKELLSDSREIDHPWEGRITVGESLRLCLKRFHQYGQLGANHHYDIYWRENDYEFFFREDGTETNCPLCGGIVFHGAPDTGYQTNNSVQIIRSYGWSTHT